MRFSGKNVLVTGAAAGIGRHIALAFAKEGADVVVIDFQDAAATVGEVTALRRRSTAILADIRNETAVRSGIKQATAFFDGRIDVLVNNAGFNGHYHQVKDMLLAEWRETLDINLTGTMLVTREVLPSMLARGSGAVTTIASNVAKRGLPYRADYVCSKWALLGFNQTLALEMAPHNIRVNAVCPGPIEGDRIEDVMRRHADVEKKTVAEIREAWEAAAPMNRFIEPDEVVAVTLFLSSDDASGMTGQAINVTGGFIMN
jgi:2-hydroxycyclohexanecarboxyl-CoA dehydrogenase